MALQVQWPAGMSMTEKPPPLLHLYLSHLVHHIPQQCSCSDASTTDPHKPAAPTPATHTIWIAYCLHRSQPIPCRSVLAGTASPWTASRHLLHFLLHPFIPCVPHALSVLRAALGRRSIEKRARGPTEVTLSSAALPFVRCWCAALPTVMKWNRRGGGTQKVPALQRQALGELAGCK